MEATVDRGWRKSSYSGNGGQCIEVADHDSRVMVRDTTDRQGPTLQFTPDAWHRLVKQIKQSLAQTAKKSLHRLMIGAGSFACATSATGATDANRCQPWHDGPTLARALEG